MKPRIQDSVAVGGRRWASTKMMLLMTHTAYRAAQAELGTLCQSDWIP